VSARFRTCKSSARSRSTRPESIRKIVDKNSLAVSLLLSGCACYHTESPARIFTDASGEVRVVPNPDDERVGAVRADHARRGNERRNLPSVRRHHPRRDTMKESLHLLFKSLHEDASLASTRGSVGRLRAGR